MSQKFAVIQTNNREDLKNLCPVIMLIGRSGNKLLFVRNGENADKVRAELTEELKQMKLFGFRHVILPLIKKTLDYELRKNNFEMTQFYGTNPELYTKTLKLSAPSLFPYRYAEICHKCEAVVHEENTMLSRKAMDARLKSHLELSAANGDRDVLNTPEKASVLVRSECRWGCS